MREATETVSTFFERLWNGRELALADQLIDPGCHTHQLQSGVVSEGVPRGPEAIRHHVGDWLRAFPDLRMQVRQSLAEGDRVATHCTMIGTQQGPWMGIPATGKRIELEMMVIHRIRDGRIVEDWVLVESYGLFQQLGLLPTRQALLEGAKVPVQPS